jgi:GLPGLI family protein
MRKTIFILTLLLGVIINAQNKRFVYEYKYISDSTKKDESKTEDMFLDVLKKGSTFLSKSKYVSDSIVKDQSRKGNTDFSNIQFSTINYVVKKSYPDFKISSFDNLDLNQYKVSDERKLSWKTLPDKEKIGEFNVQKATTVFAGREWTGWFTPDIPIQDGPYKFHGLPGLIIKMEDKTNSHSFVLKEIKSLKNDKEWIESNILKIGNLISVDHKKYKKQFLEYRNNPLQSTRELLQSGQMVMSSASTEEKSTEELLRIREKEIKDENAKDNNLLELDLLK